MSSPTYYDDWKSLKYNIIGNKNQSLIYLLACPTYLLISCFISFGLVIVETALEYWVSEEEIAEKMDSYWPKLYQICDLNKLEYECFIINEYASLQLLLRVELVLPSP